MLDSIRVFAPAPKLLGSDIKTHLKSRCHAILIVFNVCPTGRWDHMMIHGRCLRCSGRAARARSCAINSRCSDPAEHRKGNQVSIKHIHAYTRSTIRRAAHHPSQVKSLPFEPKNYLFAFWPCIWSSRIQDAPRVCRNVWPCCSRKG